MAPIRTEAGRKAFRTSHFDEAGGRCRPEGSGKDAPLYLRRSKRSLRSYRAAGVVSAGAGLVPLGARECVRVLKRHPLAVLT